MNNYKKIKQLSVDEMAIWIALNLQKAINEFVDEKGNDSDKFTLDVHKYASIMKDWLLEEEQNG